MHITVSYSFPRAHTLTAIPDLFSWKLSISHGPAFTVDTACNTIILPIYLHQLCIHMVLLLLCKPKGVKFHGE